MKQKQYFLILILILLISAANLFSQKGTVVLLKGTVTDARTGSPISVKMNMFGSGSKKYIVQSNSTDGSYQQSINSGDTYSIIIDGYMLEYPDNILEVPPYSEYIEIEKNIPALKIESGMKLFDFDAFTANDSKLTQNGLDYLNQLKNFLLLNQKVVVEIKVSTSDSYFKPLKKKVQVPGSKKPKTKTMTVTTQEQLAVLADMRIDAIRSFFRDNKLREKSAEFIPVIIAAKQTSKKPKSKKIQEIKPIKTISITISKVLKL